MPPAPTAPVPDPNIFAKLKGISDSLAPEKEGPIGEAESEVADLNRAQQLSLLRQSEQPNNRSIKTQTQILQELQLRADRHYYERLVRDQVRQLASETERSRADGSARSFVPPKDEAQVRKESLLQHCKNKKDSDFPPKFNYSQFREIRQQARPQTSATPN